MHGNKRIFTETEIKKIIKLYIIDNLTIKKVSSIMGVCREKIVDTLKDNKILISSKNKRLKLTESIINKIIKGYNSGKSSLQLAKQFKCSYGSILKILHNNNNIDIKQCGSYKTINFSEDQIKNIIDLYENKGLVLREIGNIMGCSWATIRRLLSGRGITIKDSNEQRTYKCNDKFLDIIGKSQAYFIGVMLADGCISKNHKSYQFSICQAEKDKGILEYIKYELQFEGNIIKVLNAGRMIVCGSECNVQNQYRLSITSKPLIDKMKLYGIIPNKTHITRFPKISNELLYEFLRGLIDGDGTVGLSKGTKTKRRSPRITISIVGTEKLIKEIQKVITIKSNVHKDKRTTTTFCINWIGDNAIKLGKLVFNKDLDLFKSRKYHKFWNNYDTVIKESLIDRS